MRLPAFAAFPESLDDLRVISNCFAVTGRNVVFGGRKLIKLSGKYRSAIDAYVKGISLEGWYQTPQTNTVYRELVELITNLHGKFMDEGDVHSMLQDEVAYFIFSGPEGRAGKLSDPMFADDASMLADKILAKIESFPRAYELRVELPAAQFFGDFDSELSARASIVAGPYDFVERYVNMQSALARALEVGHKKATYLLLRVEGYGGTDYGGNAADAPATREAISLAKQIAFVLTAHGIVDQKAYAVEKARCSLTDLTTKADSRVELPQSAMDCFSSLAFNIENLRVYDYSNASSLLGGSNRPTKDDDERLHALTRCMTSVARFFSTASHPDHASIVAAMEWHQDSLYADNQTFAYLAACIGLEALLAGSETLGNMTRQLVDRYSFLMGTSRQERDRLSKDYKHILHLRGELVHAKQSRLGHAERGYLRKVQGMLSQVIWRELQNMYRDFDLKHSRSS
jgi:hypothetical protein